MDVSGVKPNHRHRRLLRTRRQRPCRRRTAEQRGGTVVLHGRGRDLIEIEKAVSFNKDTCVWTVTGNVPDVRSSAERKAVLTAMQEIGGPASVQAIAASAELKQANVRRMLARLAEKGSVQRCERGKYKLADGENSHAG